MTSLCSSLVTNNHRVSFVHSKWRSVREYVSKDLSPCQGVVTFTFPHTLRQSLAQTARTGHFWWMFSKSVLGTLAQMVLRTCKPKKDLPPRTINGHTTYLRSLASRLCYFGCPRQKRPTSSGWPLFYSCKHGWTYRVMPGTAYTTHQTLLNFHLWASCFTNYHPRMVWRQMLAAHSRRPS